MAGRRVTHKPRFEAWLAQLSATLEPEGAKTELAAFMAKERRQKLSTWRVNISRIIAKSTVINAEDFLTIQAWLDGRR